MITWFDALLVTLLAASTALGARRGLSGGLWGGLALLACLLVNFIGRGWLALPLALALGFGAALLAQRTFNTSVTPWHMAVGGLGGFMVGALLVATLALAFPIKQVGVQKYYPSSNLPPAVYNAVLGSYIQTRLAGVWTSRSTALKTLLIPDQSPR